ncbi:DUF5602 domain-containing protein [Flavobacterium sp. H122]|uniref:DUF5602 domain-containing protein n=1 Tax=Flavobacterium sp. H122 TaxID=2529860 RepID=UPI0010AAC81B|nr:DUF5602 domain-containing protein [Flavobacterium sp. H122]
MKKLVLIGSLFLIFSCTQEESSNDDLLRNTPQSVSQRFDPEKVNIFKGPEVEVGNGIARSWISIKKETGIPQELGIVLTPEALENLPDNNEHGERYIIPLHLKARQYTPFDHIDLNWNPHGHLPPGVFDVAHFDIHFYLISLEEQDAIPVWSPDTDAAFNNYPPSGYMPSDYFTPPGPATAEPKMGKHWLPVNLESLLPFTKIMIYGSYNGKLTFVEPMITMDYLMSHQDFSEAYSQPQYFNKGGNYPRRYNIYHDSKTGNIYITLSDFVPRESTPHNL